MKSKIIIAFTIFVVFCFNVTAQIEVATNGNVGIKNTPSPDYALYIYGSARATSSFIANGLTANYCNTEYLSVDGDNNYVTVAEIAGDTDYDPVVHLTGESWMDYALRVDHNIRCASLYQSSDISLKKDVQPLNGEEVLTKLSLLEGKKYKLKSDEALADRIKERNPEIDVSSVDEREYYGFIAQELEELFPELVKTDSIEGLKAINYSGMIPLLLEAIKEQQKQIEAFQFSISQLKSLTSMNDEDAGTSQAILYQNKPNPYSTNTTISYNIPDEVGNAMICIYDLNGTQLKCYHLNQTGLGELIVYGNELRPGMFTYSLIVDGTFVDSKRMILTE